MRHTEKDTFDLMPLCRFDRRLKTHGGRQARFTTPGDLRHHDAPRVLDLDIGAPPER
jgi:hypothetical protein